MNAIGRFGNFIIEYQDPILIGLILIAAAAVVFLAARLFKHIKKKNAILSQINDTVSEINSAVSGCKGKDKEPDMIYIDNRLSRREEPSVQAAQDKTADCGPQSGAEQGVCPKADEIGPAEVSEFESSSEPRTEDSTESVPKEIPVRYFSRDCSVSKTGVTYTREELNSQIRE